MLLKSIISAGLGFLTIPGGTLLILAAVEIGKWIYGFDLPGDQYWFGFIGFLALTILAACIFCFIEAV